MGLKLNTASSGSVTLEPANTASNYTLTVPAQTGTVVATDASGNVGIGTTSPVTLKSATTLQVNGNLKLGNANDRGLISLGDTASTGANAGIWRGAAGAYGSAGNYLCLGGYDGITFTTGNADIASQTERMRIDSSGNLLVGRTNRLGSEKFVVGNSNNGWNSAFVQDYNVANQTNLFLFHSFASGANSGTQITFSNNSGTTVGTIASTGSATSYNTSSDYRLKENIAPMTGALSVVQQLNPVTYTWKADGSDGQGFIAHELQEVVPDCVTGEKDAVDAEGNPVYQGIDTSFLVATLTAAIQEQQAIITSQASAITALEARLTALENK